MPTQHHSPLWVGVFTWYWWLMVVLLSLVEITRMPAQKSASSFVDSWLAKTPMCYDVISYSSPSRAGHALSPDPPLLVRLLKCVPKLPLTLLLLQRCRILLLETWDVMDLHLRPCVNPCMDCTAQVQLSELSSHLCGYCTYSAIIIISNEAAWFWMPGSLPSHVGFPKLFCCNKWNIIVC